MQIIRFGENENIKITSSQNEDLFLLGTKGGTLNIELDLVKEGIEVNLYGVVLGRNSDRFMLKTLTKHSAPNIKSRVHIKGLFMDQSAFNYEGMIRVEKNASLTDAYLKNENLMIGENATVNSAPQLEILNDDVKASHGVSIRSIDENEEYYLMSRGLDRDLADKLIIKGFVNDLLQHLDDSEVNSFVEILND